MTVETYLAGLVFPVDKRQVLRHAAERGADAGIRARLEAIPCVVYCTLGELMAAVRRHSPSANIASRN
ncbi:DUF2795 domain-containing protein [Fodinicola acaciae]|uniref:DUF2795 domain-containing protein n=1 Tax=Fodinicola acaciae TaxID=2681555 RepID=UPI0013D0D18E|nr:DUF2795 domain-containing protein [Fodinicola acaciae]